MADAWDGVPDKPKRATYHWLMTDEFAAEPIPVRWQPALKAWRTGPAQDDNATPAQIVEIGYWYLGPALLPQEVAALVEAAGEQMREACVKACDWHADTLAVNGISVTSVSVARTCASILVTLPLPTPSLDAIRAQSSADAKTRRLLLAQARREGMEAAASIARAVEDKPGIRTAGDAEAAIRAAMDKEAGK